MTAPKNDKSTSTDTPDDTATDGELVDTDRELHGSEVEKYLETMDRLPVEDPEAVALEIVARRLSAQNVQDLLAPMVVTGARDLVYRPLILQSVHFNRSAYEGAVQVYAIMDCTDRTTGERFTVSCGAGDVLAQLYKLVGWDALPIDVQIVQAARPTASGFYPLHLEAAPPAAG